MNHPTLLGDVSTEGGPLLLADRAALADWSGVDGDDYGRLCDALLVAQPRALSVDLSGSAALAWNVPTGTAEVWRIDPRSVLLARTWVDEEEDIARLAKPPMDHGESLATIRITSGWLVVLWATEPGAGVLEVEPRDGLSVDLSVGGAALVIQLPPGDYECRGDEIEVGTASAWRCLVAPAPDDVIRPRSSMHAHQARFLSRIADEIDRHRRGETTLLQLFNNVWGLITAAEIQGTPEGAEVEELYLAASGADDLRHSWIPPEHRTTDSDVDAALERLRDWALGLEVTR